MIFPSELPFGPACFWKKNSTKTNVKRIGSAIVFIGIQRGPCRKLWVFILGIYQHRSWNMIPTQTSYTNIFLRDIPQKWYTCIHFDSPAKNWIPFSNDHLIKQTNKQTNRTLIKELLLPLNLPTFQTGPSCPLRCPICCCRPSVTSQIRMVPSPVSVQRIHLRRKTTNWLRFDEGGWKQILPNGAEKWWVTMVESAKSHLKQSQVEFPIWVNFIRQFPKKAPSYGENIGPDDVKQL